MYQLFMVVITLVFTSHLGLAAEKNRSSTGSASSTEKVSTKTIGDTALTTGFALPILPDSGETGFGFAFGVLTKTEASNHLFIGGDLGIHFWGNLVGNSNTTALQLLPTVVYTLGSNAKVVPYMGLSAGAYLYLNALKSDMMNTGTRIDFLLAFRPGVNWNINSKVGLNAEAKFGNLGGALLVLPTVSLNILL